MSEELNAVTMGLLAKDPENRYRDATGFVEDLERVRRGEAPVLAVSQQAPSSGSDTLADGPEEISRGMRRDATTSSAHREAMLGEQTTGVPGAPQQPSSPRTRPLLLVGMVCVLLVLLLGGGTMALTALDLGAGLLGASEPQPADGDPSARQPDDRGGATVGRTEAEETPPTQSAAPTPSGSDASRLEEEVRTAAEDYYEAVDREDWAYTYENLDSRTQSLFSEEEWFQKNQYFADNEGLELSSIEVEADLSSSGTLADVTVDRTFKDGTSIVRDTFFVSEDGSWKHRFSREEMDFFMPGVSFEEFVDAQEGGSTDDEALAEEATAVENTIRGHYEAIGEQDFEGAYSYFGPSFRSTTPEATWIEDEESFDIRSSTVHSVEVTEVSEDTSTATVDVSFEDNTGTPRFSITWELVREGGEWKLDEQISAQKTG